MALAQDAYLRIGSPDGFVLKTCKNQTPVLCETQDPHKLKAGDSVIISNAVGLTAANGVRKIKQVPTPTSFTLMTVSGTNVAGNGAWVDGGYLTWAAGPVFGGKAISYKLKGHPRVWLDGPTGDLTRQVALTKSNGLTTFSISGGVATATTSFPHQLTTGRSIGLFCFDKPQLNGTYAITVTAPNQYTFTTNGSATSCTTPTLSSLAHDKNPAWTMIVKSTSGTCLSPWLDALRWYIDRKQTASLICAKNTILNPEGMTGGYWGFGGNYPTDEAQNYGGNLDTDYGSANLVDLAFIYTLVRGQLTITERKSIQDKILNDLGDNCSKPLAKHYVVEAGPVSGVTGDLTAVLRSGASTADNSYRDLTFAIVSGPGAGQTRKIFAYSGPTKTVQVDKAWTARPTTASNYEIWATVSAQGKVLTGNGTKWLTNADPNLRLSPGDRISDDLSVQGRASKVVSVDSDTQVTLDNSETWAGMPFVYWPQWTTGSCGLEWFLKHHPASPASQPRLYPVNGGTSTYGVSPVSNTGISKVTGDILMMLAIGTDDPRAIRRLQDVWAYHFDNTFAYALNNITGFNQAGSYYGLGRVSWMNPLISWAMQSSVENLPDLGLRDVYSRETMPFLMYSWLPNSTSGTGTFPYPMWWGAENGNPPITPNSGNGQRALPTPALNANLDRSEGKAYLSWLRDRYQYSGAIQRALAHRFFLFVPAEAEATDYRTLPRQRLFRDTSQNTCSVLHITCDPENQLAGFVSHSSWDDPAGTHISSFVNDWNLATKGDHSVQEAGNYKVWKGRPLISVDGSSPQWPEALASSNSNSIPITNMIEFGGASNLNSQTGQTAIERWAGPNPTGDASSRYTYMMMNLNGVYTTAAATSRVHRHLAHFKGAGKEDVLVIYDDWATSAGRRHRGQVHYQQNGRTDTSPTLGPEGPTYCPNDPGCANLAASRTVVSLTNPSISTGVISQWFDVSGDGLRVYVDNPDGTYPGGKGNTFRVSYCGSLDGGLSCRDNSLNTEVLLVHKFLNSQIDPSITARPISGISGWTGIQLKDQVALFARQGALRTGVTLTTDHPGTAQYLVAGLASGVYAAKCNGIPIGTLSVANNDFTLYFESQAGTIEIVPLSLLSGVLVEPSRLDLMVDRPAGSATAGTLAVRFDGSPVPVRVSTDSPLLHVEPTVPGSREYRVLVDTSHPGLPVGTYDAAVRVESVAGATMIPVTVTVSEAGLPLQVSESKIRIETRAGFAAPDPSAIDLASASGEPLPIWINAAALPPWLTATASTDRTPAKLVLRVNSAGLAPGNYAASIVVNSGALAGDRTILVELIVEP